MHVECSVSGSSVSAEHYIASTGALVSNQYKNKLPLCPTALASSLLAPALLFENCLLQVELCLAVFSSRLFLVLTLVGWWPEMSQGYTDPHANRYSKFAATGGRHAQIQLQEAVWDVKSKSTPWTMIRTSTEECDPMYCTGHLISLRVRARATEQNSPNSKSPLSSCVESKGNPGKQSTHVSLCQVAVSV